MSKTGKRYDEDFKMTLVNLYNSGNHTFASLESEYGVSAATIQRWVKLYSPIATNNEDEPTNLKDLIALQKKMAQLEEENEILKKAMAILAKK